MYKDSIKKEIDLLISVKSHIWISFLAVTSGTITLSFGPDTTFKKILIVTGIILIFITFFAYFKKDDQIKILFKKLEQEK